uniref:Uncharacterized protein n=1 Tax=Arundo donax TaxID=35708 RepID=A0A0A9CQ38_ARUDO
MVAWQLTCHSQHRGGLSFWHIEKLKREKDTSWSLDHFLMPKHTANYYVASKLLVTTLQTVT